MLGPRDPQEPPRTTRTGFALASLLAWVPPVEKRTARVVASVQRGRHQKIQQTLGKCGWEYLSRSMLTFATVPALSPEKRAARVSEWRGVA